MNLIPSFKAPPTSLGKNQSSFENLKLLLSDLVMPSTSATFDRYERRSRQENMGKDLSLFDQKGLTKESDHSRAHVSSFSLFDGEIEVDPGDTVKVGKCDNTGNVPARIDRPPAGTCNLYEILNSNSLSEVRKRKAPYEQAVEPKHVARIAKERSSSITQRIIDPTAAGKKVLSSTSVSLSCGGSDIYAGVETFCRNAGATSAGLQSMVQKVRSAETVGIAVLWQCMTTNHATFTAKYCTQSSKCQNWYCTCDRHVRADYAANHLAAVVLSIPEESEYVYYLPLDPLPMHVVNTTNSSTSIGSGSSSMSKSHREWNTTGEQRVNALHAILSAKDTEKVIYNAQLALVPLIRHMQQSAQNAGHHSVHNVCDPRIAAYLCDTDMPESGMELESLLHNYHINTTYTADVAGLGYVARTILKVRAELRSVLKLRDCLQQKLVEFRLDRIYENIEMPTACLLANMELNGVAICTSFLDTLKVQLSEQINTVERKIFDSAGFTFNVASPEQISRVLFDQLQLPPPSQTSKKGKHFSTSEEDLKKIRPLHPVVDLILTYRALAKLCSTYVDGMRQFVRSSIAPVSVETSPTTDTGAGVSRSDSMRSSTGAVTSSELTNKERTVNDMNSVLMTNQASLTKSISTRSGTSSSTSRTSSRSREPQTRIHANWQQTIVRTGRLSCSKPNLQNIPNQQSIGGLQINMRSAFRASPNHLLISADYSQIEMRVLAHLCQDPALLRLFREGGDIYLRLATLLFHQPHQLDQVTSEERQRAKVICLGVLYGMGAAAAAAKLNIDVQTAGRITQTFFQHFKRMKTWIASIKSQAYEHGYVRTVLGRIRHLPDIRSADKAKASYAERQAVNSVIQGSASDIIKFAMIRVDARIQQRWWPTLASNSGSATGSCNPSCNDDNNNNDNNSNSSSSSSITGSDSSSTANAWVTVGPPPRLLMQIHDELIYELDMTNVASSSHDKTESPHARLPIPRSSLEEESFTQMLRQCMEGEVMAALKFRVPLTVNIHTGETWGDIK